MALFSTTNNLSIHLSDSEHEISGHWVINKCEEENLFLDKGDIISQHPTNTEQSPNQNDDKITSNNEGSLENQNFPKSIVQKLFDMLCNGSCSGGIGEDFMDADFKRAPMKLLCELYRNICTTVIVMNDGVDTAQEILQEFNGKLCNVSTSLIEEMRDDRPANLGAAKVGDFNDNLSYAMQDGRGLLNIIQKARSEKGICLLDQNELLLAEIDKFESTLNAAVGGRGEVEYQGSFMKTDKTIPQPPHVDFKWELLQKEKDNLFIAFFPLTNEGMFLQLWKDKKCEETTNGKIIFIPYGKMLVVPSDTIHGGGFKSGENGNLRFHLYIASHGSSLPLTHTNRYTEEYNPTKELSDRLKDACGLQELIGPFFDT